MKRKWRQAQDEAKKVGELRAKLESARERHAKAQVGLRTGDPAAFREEFNAKQADEKSVAASLSATKKAIAAAETEVDRGAARSREHRPRTDRDHRQAEPRRGQPQAERRARGAGEEVAAARVAEAGRNRGSHRAREVAGRVRCTCGEGNGEEVHRTPGRARRARFAPRGDQAVRGRSRRVPARSRGVHPTK